MIHEENAGKAFSPRNFKKKSKQSYLLNRSRQTNMVATTDSFFDRNKLYLKSVEQEAVRRGKQDPNDDSLL